MAKTRAQEQLIANWVSIILAVLSIIQGLAFNHLLIQLPAIYQHWRMSGDIRVLLHFALSFILLVRIFQTYLAAALDYNPWSPTFFDILVIFFVGGLEYFLFSTLSQPANFDVAQFHARLALIAILGVFGYLAALWRLREDLFPVYTVYAREVRLQVRNVSGVAIVLAVSMLMIVFPAMKARTEIILVATAMLALILNVLFSLKTTFSARTEESTPESGDAVAPRAGQAEREKPAILFKTPDREDVAELVGLFVDHFGYFYAAIFDTSRRLTHRLLASMFVMNHGRHSLGYKAFHVACDQKSGRIVGLFMVMTRESLRRRDVVKALMGTTLIVIVRLGLVGLWRARHNLQEMGPVVPAPGRDEMRIVYFAVAPDRRRQGVGQQMMTCIEGIARSQGKRRITLEVRERNAGAREFFKASGFREDLIIKADGDAILQEGYRIRMGTRLHEGDPAGPESRTSSRTVPGRHQAGSGRWEDPG